MADELTSLGIPAVAEPGGAAWTGDVDSVMRANLHARVASRVVVRIAHFKALSFAELEAKARKVEWGAWLSRGTPAALRVTCRKSRLYHSDAVAQRVGDAIARATGAAIVKAAVEDDDEGDAPGAQLFVVRFLHDECTISVDSSGALLHRRGWRQALGKAPLRETLAAAMLRASGWDATSPLVDPLCGSGTIPIEAALAARRIAPGLDRRFAFEQWPAFDPTRWGVLRDEARAAILPSSPAPIVGSDRDAGAIEAARANAERAGVAGDVTFVQQALSAIAPPGDVGCVVTNPPYGVRVGEEGAVRNLWAQLGKVAVSKLGGWTVTLLSPDRALDAQTRLHFEERARTSNGGLPIRILSATVPGRE